MTQHWSWHGTLQRLLTNERSVHPCAYTCLLVQARLLSALGNEGREAYRGPKTHFGMDDTTMSVPGGNPQPHSKHQPCASSHLPVVVGPAQVAAAPTTAHTCNPGRCGTNASTRWGEGINEQKSARRRAQGCHDKVRYVPPAATPTSTGQRSQVKSSEGGDRGWGGTGGSGVRGEQCNSSEAKHTSFSAHGSLKS